MTTPQVEIRLAVQAIDNAVKHILKAAESDPPFSVRKSRLGDVASQLHDVKHRLREVSNANPSPP